MADLTPTSTSVYDPKTKRTTVQSKAMDIWANVDTGSQYIEGVSKDSDFAPTKTNTGALGKTAVAKDTGDLLDSPAEATRDQTEMLSAEMGKNRASSLYLSAARFGVDVMNANSAYSSIAGAARLNVLEARRKSLDALERGKQRSLEARAEGQLEGESAILALAAQGQDVSGLNAQNVQSSLEAMGAQNALQEEINGIRESLGFELEEVAINYQMSQAATQRTTSILSSALNLGAKYYGSTL